MLMEVQQFIKKGGISLTVKDASVFIYPWDLIDEGITSVLDRLQAHQINGLNIATTYHSGMFILPHNPKRKLYFPEPGALYFEPDNSWYGKIKIKPPISKFASKKFWNDLREETSKRNMTMSSWTITLHGTYMGLNYPETSSVNAFGDLNPTIPCVSNDDVREYILSLITDLVTNYQFDNILLESMESMPLRHGYHHEVIGVPLTPVIEFLLSLSFSPSMIEKAEAAGVEILKVREFVVETCTAHFNEPEPGVMMSWDELKNAAGGEVDKYLKFRQNLLTSLVKDISKIVKGKSKLSVIDFGPVWYQMGSDGSGWESGLNFANYSPYIDEIHPTFFFNDLNVLNEKKSEYIKMMNTLQEPIVIKPIIRSILPEVTSKKDLEEQIKMLNSISRGFSFYNYSFMPLSTLDWIQTGLNNIKK